MHFELSFGPWRRGNTEQRLRVGRQEVPLRLVSNRRARRYVLRLTSDGAVRVTVPRRGSLTEARRFAERNAAWLEKQFRLRKSRGPEHRVWMAGSQILFHGKTTRLEPASNEGPFCVRLGSELIRVADPGADLRHEVERHLWKLAARELPLRLQVLAALLGINAAQITVRNQRSRWGSCSRRGTISLNWRLIQAPDDVRDYIMLHELAHLKEMNHSHRFWREVERICPNYPVAEAWLKSNASLLK